MITASIPLAKLAIQVVSGLGVTKIVADVIKSNVNIVTVFDAVKVWTAGAVVGSMVIEKSTSYIDESVDKLAVKYEQKKAELNTEITEAKKEVEETRKKTPPATA